MCSYKPRFPGNQRLSSLVPRVFHALCPGSAISTWNPLALLPSVRSTSSTLELSGKNQLENQLVIHGNHHDISGNKPSPVYIKSSFLEWSQAPQILADISAPATCRDVLGLWLLCCFLGFFYLEKTCCNCFPVHPQVICQNPNCSQVIQYLWCLYKASPAPLMQRWGGE